MQLATYFRSSAAYRVRIALAFKGLSWEPDFVDLRKGEQRDAAHRARNPQGLVPTLVDDRVTLSQSLAIIEYLDETHPEPPLLPTAPAERARVRALAQLVACDIHPLANLRVLEYLRGELGIDENARSAWYRHWVEEGLAAFEAGVAGHPGTGRLCAGDTPTLADLCLVPQLYNARRFECSLSGCPELVRIESECLRLDAFAQAAPEAQPDWSE